MALPVPAAGCEKLVRAESEYKLASDGGCAWSPASRTAFSAPSHRSADNRLSSAALVSFGSEPEN